MTRQRLFALLVYAVLLGAVGWFLVAKWDEVVAQLRRLPARTLALLFLTMFASLYLTARRLAIQLRIFRLRLRFEEWFGLTVCNSMFNYLPARGGTAMLALYLKQRHAFSYARLFLLAAVSYLFFFALSAGLSSTALVIIAAAGGGWYGMIFWPLVISVSVSVLAFANVLASRSHRLQTPFRRLNELFHHLSEGLSYFRGQRRALVQLGALYLASLAVFTLRAWLIFRALGTAVPPLKLAVVQSIAEFSTLIAVTPGNLGVKEGLTVFSAGLLGIGPASMMVVALLDRALSMALVFLLGPVFAHRLLGKGGGLRAAA